MVSKSVLWPCQSRKLSAETTLLPPPGGFSQSCTMRSGCSVGQRLEQRAIHEAEDGAVGADAEREGQDGNRREAGRLDQGPKSVSEVLDDVVKHTYLPAGRVPG